MATVFAGERWFLAIAALFAGIAGQAGAHSGPGEAAAGAELYRESFLAAPGFPERLALMGPLARACFVNQNLESLLENPRRLGVEGMEEWEHRVHQAAGFQYLQDLNAARRQLAAVDRRTAPPELAEFLLRQEIAWAEEMGDPGSAREALKEEFEKNQTDENHRAYLRALLEAGAEEELLEHLGDRAEGLRREANFWRSLLPELKRTDLLRPVSVHLERAWQREEAGAEVVFPLAELRVFQGRMEEAADLFWTVFEMEERVMPSEGREYFQRLNSSFRNRFAVKNRLGRATGRYGTAMCHEFSFLGMREDFHISETGVARDAALLYLRELAVANDASGEFLQRIRRALDGRNGPPAERILAFAVAGGVVEMMNEIEAFVRSPVRDDAAAEFSLWAMNRFVLSTEKFPQLRQSMVELAAELGAKFEGEASHAVRRGRQEIQERIPRRLGASEAEPEPGSPEESIARIERAVEEERTADAERLYRDLEGQSGAGEEELRPVLLFLARGWQAEEAHGEAARLVAEFLQPLHSPGGRGKVAGILSWRDDAGFPPSGYFSEESLEWFQAAFETVAETATWRALQEVLARQGRELPEEKRAGPWAALVLFHWWAAEPEEAIAAADAARKEVDDPEIELLLGHLLGLGGRYEEAREALRNLAAGETSAGERARRLRFALAVAAGYRDEALAEAESLAGLSLRPIEKLQIASGLVSVDLEAAAGEWVEDLEWEELNGRERELFHQVRMKVLLAAGDSDRAAAVARLVLLGEIPDTFNGLLTAARAEALAVLAAAEKIGEYRRQLKDLLGRAPESVAIHLLLGESADFSGRKKWKASGIDPEESWLAEAVGFYRRAVELRPGYGDLHLEFCEWLGRRGLWEEAALQYRALLEVDAPSALLDAHSLFEAFRRAERLPLLVDFFEPWQAPEADSMDEFYGLQPTEHLFRPLGEMLLEAGEREAAVRAWAKGLRINPIVFTEEMRMALAQVHAEAGEEKRVLALLKEYVAEKNLDPHLWVVQPFATVLPRWMGMLAAAGGGAGTPVERLIALAEKSEGERGVRAAAERWRREMPERVSLAAFCIYLAARNGEPGWRQELAELNEQFSFGF